MVEDTLSYYDSHAPELSSRFESLDFETVQGWMLPFLSKI